MDTNKKIGIVLIVLSIFFILLGVGLKKDLNRLDERKNTMKNQFENKKEEMNIKQDDITETDIASKKKMAIKAINDFIYYINIKEYEKAYNFLDKEYVKDFDIKLENFKKRYTFSNEIIIRFENYTFDHNDVGLFNTFLINKENDEFIKKTFTVYPTSNATYRLIDIGIKSSTKYLLENKANKLLEIRNIKEYKTTKGYIYIFDITNSSNETVYLSLDNWAFYNIIDNKEKKNHIPLGYGSFENMILPQEKKTYRMMFKQDIRIKNLYVTLYNGEEIQLIGEVY